MVAALRRLGFDKVFDTDFTADLTIMEEGYEFLDRVTNGGVLPMITSCSPGWINFIEIKYPDLLPHLSTAKSPQGMFGALAKTYWPETQNIPVEDIYSVSIMPCTAKKAECVRPQLQSNPGIPDVDTVLTTRELARMIKNAGIDFKNLPEEDYDSPLGTSTEPEPSSESPAASWKRRSAPSTPYSTTARTSRHHLPARPRHGRHQRSLR